MKSDFKYKTWDEFWGLFLQVTFHLNNPDRWSSRERKAQWFLNTANLKETSNILDLGCGDGLLDICLSRKDINVIALDRCQTVLEHAKKEDDTHRTRFVAADFLEVNFGKETFDAILFIEATGLQCTADDLHLLKRCYEWLKPGGIIVVDTVEKQDNVNRWQREFAFGTLYVDSQFNSTTRMHNIDFRFIGDEEEFGLKPGISRYIYTAEELATMLRFAGFTTSEVEHYYSSGYRAFVGIKPKGL